MPSPPTIYLIAGCNGAGKTTFAKEFLPKEVKCLRFLNADEIARGLSPLRPSAGAIQAARLLLNQVIEHLRRRQTFALESTLSGRTYIRLFRHARQLGYEIELHYLWLSSPAPGYRPRAAGWSPRPCR
jgi:predicted ABC-type ATPase